MDTTSSSHYQCAFGIVSSIPYVYVSGNVAGLIVVNVSTPTAPSISYQQGTSVKGAGMAFFGGHYVAMCVYQTATPWTNRFLQIWDVSTATAPTNVSQLTMPSATGKPVSVQVFGNTAFVTDSNSAILTLCDITTPTSTPTVLSTINLAAIASTGKTCAVGSNGVLYIFTNSSVYAYDISNRAAPILITSSACGAARSGVVSGNFLYMGNQTSNRLDVFTDVPQLTADKVVTANLQLLNAPSSGYVLSSDSLGNAVWSAPSVTSAVAMGLTGDVTGNSNSNSI